DPPAQRVGQGPSNYHIGEVPDQLSGPGKVDRLHVFGLSRQFSFVLSRCPRDQHALHGADHAFGDGRGLRVDARLQTFQAGVLDGIRRVVLEVGGGRTGTARVDEGKRLVETDVLDQLHRLLEVRIGFAGEADDEVGTDRDI